MTPKDVDGNFLIRCDPRLPIYVHEWKIVRQKGNTYDQRSRRRICTSCKLISIRRGPSGVYKKYITKEYEEEQMRKQLIRELQRK